MTSNYINCNWMTSNYITYIWMTRSWALLVWPEDDCDQMTYSCMTCRDNLNVMTSSCKTFMWSSVWGAVVRQPQCGTGPTVSPTCRYPWNPDHSTTSGSAHYSPEGAVLCPEHVPPRDGSLGGVQHRVHHAAGMIDRALSLEISVSPVGIFHDIMEDNLC